MKLFLKITAGVVTFIILIGVGLNLYFTDERLKRTVMPHLNETLGRESQVESMSLSFFSTFPRPGLSIKQLVIPGETDSDTLLTLEELLVSVELFSLLGDQISISELTVLKPDFTYEIYADNETNIDFLMQEEEPADTAETFTVNIPNFHITEGNFGYRDETSATDVRISDLNANIALRYGELIQSTVDLQAGGLSASMDDTAYVSNLPVSLRQESIINLNEETVTIEEGTFSIRGLALNLSGSISDWSNNLQADLTFTSSSDNFGELLGLVPEEYEEQIEGLETKGSLSLDGSLNGYLTGDNFPSFKLALQVKEGYLKNPDLPEPIQDIQLDLTADNNLVNIQRLTAHAGENNFSATGQLSDPLKEDGSFNLQVDGNVDLSTVNQFWDINELDIDRLGGQLTVVGNASGQRSNPEEASFDAEIQLSNGILKYTEAPQAIESISVDANATDEKISIEDMQLQAASNTFSLQGVVNNPLKENQRTVDLAMELEFNLATIKEFYPIDEDTLEMRGELTANAILKGAANQLEQAAQSGNITLQDGYISHQSLSRPIENLRLESQLNGSRLIVTGAGFTTGQNKLSAEGTVTDYLGDNPMIDLTLTGDAAFDQLGEYYELEPTITNLTGSADINLRTTGPIKAPAEMNFDGNLSIRGVNMEGEGLVQPVRNLQGQLTLSPKQAELQNLSFDIGSSDITVNGSLTNYREYLKEAEDRGQIPHLQGSYRSELLNLDELINWDDTTDAPVPIHLPHLTSSVEAEISRLIVTDVPMQDLKAQAGTTPERINLEQASVQLFEGEANGSFVWEVPQPDRTHITFEGSLKNLQAGSFFATYPILGENSRFDEYVTGAFSADVNYSSELDEYLQPVMQSSQMDGSFGMTNSRIQNHPVQTSLTSMLKAEEFNNIGLDEWESTYTLENNLFTIKNLRLTSTDIGLEMNGTQHMVTDEINYQMQLRLPGRFKGAIASIISKQAAEALMQDDETIMVPLRVTGTQESPKINPDKEVITPIIQEYLKGKGRNLLKDIFNGNR